MLKFLTSGESHGKQLTLILEGIPSNLQIDFKRVNHEMCRRKIGYGRSYRMRLDKDELEITSGIRYGKTTGAPISINIANNEWKKWEHTLSIKSIDKKVAPVSIPRPGHADINGVIKYNFDDIRNSIERSSARETASRVAIGAICKEFLSSFNIKVLSWVNSIGSIETEDSLLNDLLYNRALSIDINDINNIADKSLVRVLNQKKENDIISIISKAKREKETLGGIFTVVAVGVPIGLGSYISADEKLDAAIAKSIMSINAIKGVEIGAGFRLASTKGSEAHDEICFEDEKILRKTNLAGGIEGGISNGMPIILRAVMKPIPTLMEPLNSIDLRDFSSAKAFVERSDYTAVPAASVVAESMLAITITEFFLRKFGGDSLEETTSNHKNYINNIINNIKKNFS